MTYNFLCAFIRYFRVFVRKALSVNVPVAIFFPYGGLVHNICLHHPPLQFGQDLIGWVCCLERDYYLFYFSYLCFSLCHKVLVLLWPTITRFLAMSK